MPGPFDDELTPEEEALLKTDALPPAEEEGEGTVADAVAEAEAQPAAETKPAEPTPADPPAAETPTPEADEDAALAEFLEKHKDKSPEELTRLAFQQSKRASREAAQNRQTRDQVSALADRARRAAEARQSTAADIEAQKQAFRERLTTDPDAAVTELFDSLQNNRLAAADANVIAARQEEAIAFADTHIADFGNQWTGMKGLANELGYSDAEMDNIDDGRALVVLSLANHAARLMKAGIMDRAGNIDMSKVPTADLAPVDPRLAAPSPQPTMGGGRGGAKTNPSVTEQLNDLLSLSDEDFNKLDPKVLEDLMRKAA